MRLLTFVLIMAGLALVRPATPLAAEIERTISVNGYAEIDAVPDRATASAGVVAQASTAASAMEQNTRAMRGVLAALTGMGVEAADIRTSNLSVSPVFDEVRTPRVAPRIVAYRVANTVTVLVREPDRLGEILDALLTGGANTLNGVRFFVARDEALQDQLRVAAVRDARRRAAMMAEAAGATLGPVVTIREAGAAPRPVASARLMAESAGSVPVSAGTETLSTTVSVVFELRPGP